MDILSIVLLGGFLFVIIHGAVSMALRPLVESERNLKSVKNDILYRLRDEGIISEADIREYHDEIRGLKDFEEVRRVFIEAKHVLKVLHDSERITSAEYDTRLDKLKSRYSME